MEYNLFVSTQTSNLTKLRRHLHILTSRFVTLIFSILALSNTAFALDAVTLQLSGKHSFQFAGYYAAQEQGYFREAGLAVNFVESQTGIDTVKQVIDGKADYGTGNSSLLLEKYAGKPVVLLAVIFQHSQSVLIARQTQSIHDLADQAFMLDPQAREILAYLKSEGIALDHITLHENSDDPQDLISGKTIAISAFTLAGK